MARKNTVLLSSFLLTGLLSFAQPTIEWSKSYGGSLQDGGDGIQITSDGGYVVYGFANSLDGDVVGNHSINTASDAWVVKLSSNGIIEWQKALGGTAYEEATSLVETNDGGFLVAGYTGSINNGDVSGFHGNVDAWLVKLANDGTIEWQHCYGGSGEDVAGDIKPTDDGGYVFCGRSNSNDGDVSGGQGNLDYWVVKIDATGAIEWQKMMGGTAVERAEYIEQTTDGGYIITGYTSSSDGDVTGFQGNEDVWVVKLSSTGTMEWQKSLGGTGYDESFSIKQTVEGGFILAGLITSTDGDITGNHGSGDAWIVKLSATGVIEWQKACGGTGYDYATAINLTSDGGYIFAGNSNSGDGDVSGPHGGYDFWFVKTNNTGTIEWQKMLGGSGTDQTQSKEIHETTDNGFIMTGFSESINGDLASNYGQADIWVVKLSAPAGISSNTMNNLIHISPNPATDKITISAESQTEITLSTLLGEQLFTQSIFGETSIDISTFPSGVYLLSTENGETSRFVKE